MLDQVRLLIMKSYLEKDKGGNTLIPFSSVMAMGDFMVIAEEDII